EPSFPERYASQRTQRFSDTDRWYESPYIADLSNTSLISLIYLDERDQPERLEVRAGGSIAQSVLLASTEAVTDEVISLAQVPDDVFDATPPDTVLDINSSSLRWPDSPTITLDREQVLPFMTTPMFGLPQSRDLILSGYEANFEGSSAWSDGLFDSAVWNGMAMKANYIVNGAYFTMYMAAADTLMAYLRSHASWLESKPGQVIIDGRTINAWEFEEQNGDNWVLAELDGTLLVIQVNRPEQREAMPLLERMGEEWSGDLMTIHKQRAHQSYTLVGVAETTIKGLTTLPALR
ncbi:MAG: hypothetical protein GFH27_549431n52, partial [Chloroflexi bacterium AL-W]|nr:hypothetical protein [Chloroflexi bacterium AL-N1]NOK71656.1 hypothetical protein [Chloroflexi bacterium AL-N10]NOK78956.1 hypothetical protein [Chloroflexi bacterium AL-N5]NOK86431.1 hypothetical protein [Chloroflexi bacterium AL-W]